MAVQAGGYKPDGTQPTPTQPMYPDPVAGLITGETAHASQPGTDSSDFVALGQRRFESDSGSVNELIRAAFEEDPLPGGDRSAGERPAHVDEASGQPQRQAQRDTAPPAKRLLSDAGAQAKRVVTDDATRSSAGIAVAVILVFVFAVLAVGLVASLVGSLS